MIWIVASEDITGACNIDTSVTPEELLCNVGTMDSGDTFTVRVQTTIPSSAGSAPVIALLGASDFNATDGNLLLDNSEVQNYTGPAVDTNDWESFTDIDCDSIPTVGCARDVPAGNNDNSYTRGAKEDTRNPATSVGSIPPSKDDLDRWYYAQEFIDGKACHRDFIKEVMDAINSLENVKKYL